MAFDGERVLDRLIQANGIATFSLRPEGDTSVPLHNARLLGLPRAPNPQVSVEKRLRSEGRLIDVSTRGSVHTLTIVTPRPDQGSQRLEVSLDADKGWSVIEYTMQDTPPTIPQFVCKGFVTPALFGDTWYPSYVKIEQWRDDKLDWTREYTVSEAQLNVKLEPDTFTWDGLGIYDGAMIVSRIPGVPGTDHRTAKPSPDFSHRCPEKMDDKPK
jgi:hypothetical protein